MNPDKKSELLIYFEKNIAAHPSVRAEDAVKLCYQAVFGPEHLISDTDAAYGYLAAEFDETPPEDIPVCEKISPEYCRVNIAGWKYFGRNAGDLFRLFLLSASPSSAAKEDFSDAFEICLHAAKSAGISFESERERRFLASYLAGAPHPVHHSPEYRAYENPHYRLVKNELLDRYLSGRLPS